MDAPPADIIRENRQTKSPTNIGSYTSSSILYRGPTVQDDTVSINRN